MQSSLHGMIDKAHRYAEEPGRVRLAGLEAFVRGDNNSEHAVKLSAGSHQVTLTYFPRAFQISLIASAFAFALCAVLALPFSSSAR